jgi:hypothetical protein
MNAYGVIGPGKWQLLKFTSSYQRFTDHNDLTFLPPEGLFGITNQ